MTATIATDTAHAIAKEAFEATHSKGRIIFLMANRVSELWGAVIRQLDDSIRPGSAADALNHLQAELYDLFSHLSATELLEVKDQDPDISRIVDMPESWSLDQRLVALIAESISDALVQVVQDALEAETGVDPREPGALNFD